MNKKVIEFIDKHNEYYQELNPHHIRAKIKYGYYSATDQIFCHLNLIAKQKTAYFKFCKLLEKEFNLKTKNILEVSSGLLPIISYYLKRDFDVKDITTVNKQFIFKPYRKINVIEKDFLTFKNLDNYNLVIGFRPCIATEKILDLCFKFKKNFVIYLCPCEDIKPFNKHIKCTSAEEWRNYIINKAKSNNNFNIEVIYNHNLQDNLPIIIGKVK